MPGSVAQISRRQPKIGFRPALQRHRADRAMCCLRTWSPSIFRAVILRSIVGPLRALAVLIPNTAKQVMTLIFAGDFSRPGGSFPSVQRRSFGTIDASLSALF